jgi:hypothetical protein
MFHKLLEISLEHAELLVCHGLCSMASVVKPACFSMQETKILLLVNEHEVSSNLTSVYRNPTSCISSGWNTLGLSRRMNMELAKIHISSGIYQRKQLKIVQILKWQTYLSTYIPSRHDILGLTFVP